MHDTALLGPVDVLVAVPDAATAQDAFDDVNNPWSRRQRETAGVPVASVGGSAPTGVA